MGFFDDLKLKDILNTGAGAYGEYEKSRQEAAKADAAQKNYQASLNLANMSKANLFKLAIAGVVAVLVAFFIFKK